MTAYPPTPCFVLFCFVFCFVFYFVLFFLFLFLFFYYFYLFFLWVSGIPVLNIGALELLYLGKPIISNNRRILKELSPRLCVGVWVGVGGWVCVWGCVCGGVCVCVFVCFCYIVSVWSQPSLVWTIWVHHGNVSLKGVLHLLPKLVCFVLYLKLINTFLKNNICILWKIVHGIGILVGQAVFEL